MKNLRHRVTHVLKYVMHLHAIVALIGGIYRSRNASDETDAILLMAQYVLYAIFFELIALNIQLGRLIDFYNKNKLEEKEFRENGGKKKKKD